MPSATSETIAVTFRHGYTMPTIAKHLSFHLRYQPTAQPPQAQIKTWPWCRSYFYGTSRNTDWGGLMAASTLTAIPVVIFFLLVQRRIARSGSLPERCEGEG